MCGNTTELGDAGLEPENDEVIAAIVGPGWKLAAKVAPRGAIAATERSLLAAIAAAGGITRPDVERVGHFTQRTATEAA